MSHTIPSMYRIFTCIYHKFMVNVGRYAIHGCVISWKSFYYSFLYLTGSMEFNREMRTIAKDKCYKFSEYGLYDENNQKESEDES